MLRWVERRSESFFQSSISNKTSIDKIIFTFFLNFLFSFSFPSFSLVSAFYSSSIVSCISDPAIFFLMLQISSSVSSNSSFLLFQCNFPHSLAWLHLIYHQLLFLFLNFNPFFLFFPPFSFFLFPHSPLFPLHILITPL